MLTRDPALDTRTHTALHSDTTSGCTLRGSAHTTLGHSSSTTPGHHFRMHSSSGFALQSRARQDFTTSRSELQTRARCRTNTHLIHDPSSGFALSASAASNVLLLHEPQLFTSRSSYTVFSKSRSIPSATTQKHPNPLSSHLTAHKSTFHFFSQSLDLHSQLTQIAIPKPDLSSKGFN